MTPQPIYTRLHKVQEVFGIHRATVYRWADQGIITIYKRGSISVVRNDEMRAVFGDRCSSNQSL